MNRSHVLIKTANALLLTLLIAISSACHSKDERPNIIVVLADDMGYSDLGVMGSEIETPALDALANEGVLFTHMYNTARCSTTRASLMTGLYSHAAGIGHLDKDHKKPGYRGFITDNAVTVAEVLSAEGYRTILSGKWHIGVDREQWPDKRGFERFYGIPKGGGLYFIPSPFIDRPIYRNGKLIHPKEEGYYTTDAFTEEAIDFIAESKDEGKPFFLYLAHIAPHFPLQAKQADIDKYKGKYAKGYEAVRNARFKRQQQLGVVPHNTVLSPIAAQKKRDKNAERKMEVYAAQVDSLDQNMARLVQSLKDMGLYDNTLILFLSDNGAASSAVFRKGSKNIGSIDSFVSYGKQWANVSNTPYREYKKYAHEGGILTPLIMHWPKGLKQKGVVNHTPLHVIDIVPTALEAAGVTFPTRYNDNALTPLHGESIFPRLLAEPINKERLLFWEHEGNKAVRYGDIKAVAQRGQPWELYDLANDPTELNNMATLAPDVVQKLDRAYQHWANTVNVEPWPLKK